MNCSVQQESEVEERDEMKREKKEMPLESVVLFFDCSG
jgi:hypothetical protein